MSFTAAFKTMASTLARPMAVKAPVRAQFARVAPGLRAAPVKARAFHAAQPAMARVFALVKTPIDESQCNQPDTPGRE
jgi:hypothetical protein